MLILEFLPNFLGEEVLGDKSWLSLFTCPPADRPGGAEEATRREGLEIGRRMEQEFVRKDRNWETAIRLEALRLLFLISRHWDPPTDTEPNFMEANKLRRILPALQLVRDKGFRRVGLKEAASLCSMSENHFDLTFKRVMGLGFGQFALRFRLSWATRDLVEMDLPIHTIAERWGFSDVSHFARAFKQIYQIGPTQYRRRQPRSPPAVVSAAGVN